MFDRKDALHWNDLNWKPLDLQQNGLDNCQKLNKERTVFWSEIMLVVKDTQCATNNIIYCFLEIWNNVQFWLNRHLRGKKFRQICYFRYNEEMASDKNASIYKTFKKKIKYSRHSIFGNWDESRNHRRRRSRRRRIHCRMPESSIIVALRAR